MNSRPETHIRRIVKHCAEAPDYLLPDTPLKESIFRLILAGSNKPVTPEEISRDLTVKWALSANRRNVSQRVIQRLLDNSASYCVVREPEPEPEPPPAPAVEQLSLFGQCTRCARTMNTWSRVLTVNRFSCSCSGCRIIRLSSCLSRALCPTYYRYLPYGTTVVSRPR